MQAELFKRNAVIFMQDEMQQLLYHDVLAANGYAVQDASSASDLMGKISCSTDLIFLDVDAVNEDSVKIISKKAKEKNYKAPLIGLSVAEDAVNDECFSAVIKKPIFIDDMIAEIDNAFYRLNELNLQAV